MLKVAGLFMVLSFIAAFLESAAGYCLIKDKDVLGKPLLTIGIVHALGYLSVLAYIQS